MKSACFGETLLLLKKLLRKWSTVCLEGRELVSEHPLFPLHGTKTHLCPPGGPQKETVEHLLSTQGVDTRREGLPEESCGLEAEV